MSDVFLLHYLGGDNVSKVIICSRDCGKSICMKDVFLPHYLGVGNVKKGLWQINMHEQWFSFAILKS